MASRHVHRTAPTARLRPGKRQLLSVFISHCTRCWDGEGSGSHSLQGRGSASAPNRIKMFSLGDDFVTFGRQSNYHTQ